MTKYPTNELKKLWLIIKKYEHKFRETNTGLKEVTFSIPLHEFETRYQTETQKNNVETAQVKKSIKEVIATITQNQNQIRCHHLSCAAETIYKSNASLCIHYTDTVTKKNHAITIPGVTYIPTQQTLEKLKKIEERT